MQKEKIITGSQIEEKFEEISLTRKDFSQLILSSLYLSLKFVIVLKCIALVLSLYGAVPF